MINFTAFDFETARGKYACALGLAKFRNGELSDKRYYLINPEIDDWNPIAMKIHGIKPIDVLNAPNFKSISNEIFEFLGNDDLVAHQCSTDYSILQFMSNLDLSKLQNNFHCTLNYSRSVLDCDSYKLSKLVNYCKLSEFSHHNALDDAIACGELFNFLLAKDSMKLADSRYEINESKARNSFYYEGVTIFDEESIIRLDQQDKNAFLDRKSTIFENLKFVPSGSFVNFSRNEITSIIENNSGKKLSSISKRTDYVIAGQNMGPAKYKKAEELGVQIISEQEFLEMI